MLFTSSDAQLERTDTQAEIQIPKGVDSFPTNGSAVINKSEEVVDDSKTKVESLAFGYQFAEVDKAISNFTKHQPFNHHYAPNVNVNRNHHHHHHNNHNHRFNNGGNNYNNGRYQKQQNFNSQMKQQQPVQYINSNSNGQSMNRFRPMNNGNGLQQQHQQNVITQQPFQVQQHSGVYQQNQLSMNSSGVNNEYVKFDSFQTIQPHYNHSDLMRNHSPTYQTTVRPGSSNGFGSSLEPIHTNGSSPFALNGSDFLNTPLTNSSTPVTSEIDQSLSLNDSNTYLGDIWGSSKSGLKNSASVWA